MGLTRATFSMIDGAAVNVQDYGAVGDGVADDTAAIQSAISAAYGKTLYFPSGDYRLTDSLLITGSIDVRCDNDAIINGADIPVSTVLSEYCVVQATGTIGNAIALTSNLTTGDQTVVVGSTSTFAVGDMVLLSSNAFYSTGVSTGTNKQGWVSFVSEVVNSTTLRVSNSAYADLNTADTAVIQKITPVTVRWTGGKILGGGVGAGHDGFPIAYAKDCVVSGVVIDGCEGTAHSYLSAYNCHAKNMSIRNASSNALLGNTGYGFAVLDGSEQCSISDSAFEHCRHSVSGGGAYPARFVTIKNNMSQDCGIGTNDYDCHEPCFYWLFDGNTTVGGYRGRGGFIIRGKNVTLTNNHCVNVLAKGIQVTTFISDSNGQTDIVIDGNQFENCRYGISLETTAGTIVSKCVVSNNLITNSELEGIYAAEVNDLVVSNNIIDTVTSAAGDDGACVRLYSATIGDLNNVLMSGNTFKNPSDSCVKLNNTQNVVIDNCYFEATGSNNGVLCTTSDLLTISGCSGSLENTFVTCSGNKISVSDCSMTITDAGTTADFCRAVGSTNTQLYVTNNECYGTYRYGVYATSYNVIIATSNDFIEASQAPAIQLSGAATQVNANNLT